MEIRNYRIAIKSPGKGFHLITNEIIKNIPTLPEKGILHLFIQHTSAALTINENYDPDVRDDLTEIMNRLVPENTILYQHSSEGADDMPAHAKSSIIGYSLSIPIENKKLLLGTWQGIYLCEFRNKGGIRNIIATVIG